MLRISGWVVAAAMVVAAADQARAAVITLDAIDAGWYENHGIHFSTNPNYIVGDGGSAIYRNWFVFDLSGITDRITSAELRIFNPINGYVSPDPTETYELYDVSTAVATLQTSHSTGSAEGLSIFGDLGTGTLFGSRVVSAADNGTLVSISLNAAAAANLNAATSLWAIGGSLSTIGSVGVEVFTAGTGSHLTRQLVVTTSPAQNVVPEPGSLALLATGGIGMFGGWYRKRRKNAAAV